MNTVERAKFWAEISDDIAAFKCFQQLCEARDGYLFRQCDSMRISLARAPFAHPPDGIDYKLLYIRWKQARHSRDYVM